MGHSFLRYSLTGLPGEAFDLDGFLRVPPLENGGLRFSVQAFRYLHDPGNQRIDRLVHRGANFVENLHDLIGDLAKADEAGEEADRQGKQVGEDRFHFGRGRVNHAGGNRHD